MRAHDDREKFLEIIEEVPLVSVAAQRAGIAKSTIYRWKQSSKTFAQALDKALKRGRHNINDLAESQLINLIRKGDFKSVRYWLDNNNRRYVRPRPPEPVIPVTAVEIRIVDPAKIRKAKKKPILRQSASSQN